MHAPGARTGPDDARRFVEATRVDWLAVAVGTSHAMTTREAAIDSRLIERIAETVPVPLVLHGASAEQRAELREFAAAPFAAGSAPGTRLDRAPPERAHQEPITAPRGH